MDREIAYFRTAKWAGALLFLANRYISMAVYIAALIQFATFPSDEVSPWFWSMSCLV